MIVKQSSAGGNSNIRNDELKALGFIIIVLFPVLSVFSIGAYGFIIWMIQSFGGTFGH